MATLRPADLYRAIADLVARLERLSLSKAPARPKTSVNADFNWYRHPEDLREATMQASRRI
jgi:hypothetical protein